MWSLTGQFIDLRYYDKTNECCKNKKKYEN